MIKISQWRESHYKTSTSIRRNKFERVGLRKIVTDLSRNVNNLSKKFEIEKL